MSESCKVEDCGRPMRYVAACMCALHYVRFTTHGSTAKPERAAPMDDKIARALTAGMAKAAEVGDCLEWQGSFSCKGTTPVVKVYSVQKGRTDNISVPRLLWERDNGPIPAGKLVYRKCFNNACVLHLACGTRKEWHYARRRAGAAKHSATAILHLTLAARRRATAVNTMEQARQVRSLAAARVRTAEISRQTGVHPTMVAEIRQGQSWRELAASPFAGLGA